MSSFQNKLRNVLLAGFCLFMLGSRVQAQGIKFFEGTWDQLKAEAKKQHKPFFIDCYTSWCGPCKQMSTKIFPQQAVGDFFNSHYICYSQDMEKGEGRMLAGMFGIKMYPTFIFFNADGEVIHKFAGGMPPEMFINEGKRALDPQQSLMGHIKSFNAGKRDTAFLLEFIEMSRYSDDNMMSQALEAYWKALPVADKSSAITWERFKALDNNVNSTEYNYVHSHKDAFIQKYGDEDVNKTLFEKAAYSIQYAAEIRDENLMKRAKSILDSSNVDEIVKFAALGEMMYYKSANDVKTFGSLARKYVAKYASGNADELNNMAFECASGVDDAALLNDAEKWSAQSVSIKQKYQNTDTYAHILYKQGKLKEAENAALQALELAKAENVNPAGTNELLSKMKK